MTKIMMENKALGESIERHSDRAFYSWVRRAREIYYRFGNDLTANSIKSRRIRCDKRTRDLRTIARRNFTSAMILRLAGGHDRALRKRADRSGK